MNLCPSHRSAFNRFPVLLLTLGSWALMTTGCNETSNPVATEQTPRYATMTASELENWRADIAEWHQVRDAGLRDPEGWLTLTGLYWLEDIATVGHADGQDIVLPSSAPPSLGILRIDRSGDTPSVRLDASPGQTFDVDGTSLDSAVLISDREHQPTVVASGSARFYIIDRDGRLGVRVRDMDHPALANFPGVEAFEATPQWRLQGRFEPHPVATTMAVPTVLGTSSEQQSPGIVEFEHGAQIYRIQALRGDEPGELFLVFGDLTNGHSTYGGGRFLYATTNSRRVDHETSVILDFNRAYNPPCAFSPYATCPLPPPENRLDVAIEAGEKSFGKEYL